MIRYLITFSLKLKSFFDLNDDLLQPIQVNNKLLKFFTFLGNNWLDKNKKPIAVLWNIKKREMDTISDYLPEYRTVFAHKNLILSILALLVLPEKPQVYITSGKKNIFLTLIALIHKTNIYHIEDGFLRSLGSKLSYIVPQSIVFNKNLEDILNQPIDKTLIQEAEIGISLMRVAKLTKYSNIIDKTTHVRKDKYSILVIGQAKDNPFVIYKMRRNMTNIDIIIEACDQYPDALIYYRPYSDSDSIRTSKKFPKIHVLEKNMPLHDALLLVDHVYTMTSPEGMEALLYKKKVTTFGMPFYAGWGLTDDTITSKKHCRSLSLQELFAGVYLISPRYYHPETNERIDFIELAGYFLIEKALFMDLVKMNKNIIDLESLKPYKDRLSPPVQLFLYLTDIDINVRLQRDVLDIFIKKNFRIRDFRHFSYLLLRFYNYDALAYYIDYCLCYLENNINKVSIKFLEKFFYQLSQIFFNNIYDINGRMIRDIPDLTFLINKNIMLNKKFLLYYIRCISFNMQYEILENLINLICHNTYDYQFLWQISLSIKGKIRTERDFVRRQRLIKKIADYYLLCYPDSKDCHLRSIIYNIILDDDKKVMNDYNMYSRCAPVYIGGLRVNLRFFRKSLNKLGNIVLFRYIRNFSDYHKLFNYFLLKGYNKETRDIINTHFSFYYGSFFPYFSKSIFLLKFHFLHQNTKDFLLIYNQLSNKEKTFLVYKKIYAEFLRQQGEFVKSRNVHKDILNHNPQYEKKINTLIEIQKLDFVIEAGRILTSVPQPRFSKGIVFLATHSDLNSMSMVVPPLLKVKQKGYSVLSLTEGMLIHTPTGIDYVDQFANIIPRRLTCIDSLQNVWTIDWPNKIVIADGINFYQGFYESLAITAGNRSYYVDLAVPSVYKKFKHFLKYADIVLSLCKKVFDELILMHQLHVIFVAGNTQAVFASVIRDYCRYKNHPLLSIICTTSGYENYYTNAVNKFSNTVCMIDLTLDLTIRAPFLAQRDKFESWYKQNKDNQKHFKSSKNLIILNRTTQMNKSSEEVKLIQYLEQQKKVGKRIICAFGKIPIDLAVPYDGGYAHEDIADWLNHTVRICNQMENVLLLVKPHPHEVSPQIALDLKEGFLDLLFEDINENIKLLGHNDINNHKLVPYLDLAILWNGSSAIELTAQGVPVIMCSYFGKYDYPLDLIYPKSRDQYEKFLKQGVFKIPDTELKNKATLLVSYFKTDNITLIHQYSLRPVTNDKVGVVQWNTPKIEHFLKYGDQEMDKAADRIIEKSEKNHSNFKYGHKY